MKLSRRWVMREVRRSTQRYGLTWRQWQAALDSGRYAVTTVNLPCRRRGCWHTLAALWSRS